MGAFKNESAGIVISENITEALNEAYEAGVQL